MVPHSDSDSDTENLWLSVSKVPAFISGLGQNIALHASLAARYGNWLLTPNQPRQLH